MDASAHIIERAEALCRLGYKLSSITVASPLDRVAPVIWTLGLVIDRSAAARIEVNASAHGVDIDARVTVRDVRIVEPAAYVADLDAEYLTLAWRLGAWDVSRMEHAPLPPSADKVAHGLSSHVADPYAMTGIPENPAAELDAEAWINACARHGWMTWSCKPMHLAPEVRRIGWLGKDRTLDPDGQRASRVWHAWEPVSIGADHQTVIRLGRAAHGNRSKRRE
jgi:hypothetical protein